MHFASTFFFSSLSYISTMVTHGSPSAPKLLYLNPMYSVFHKNGFTLACCAAACFIPSSSGSCPCVMGHPSELLFHIQQLPSMAWDLPPIIYSTDFSFSLRCFSRNHTCVWNPYDFPHNCLPRSILKARTDGLHLDFFLHPNPFHFYLKSFEVHPTSAETDWTSALSELLSALPLEAESIFSLNWGEWRHFIFFCIFYF